MANLPLLRSKQTHTHKKPQLISRFYYSLCQLLKKKKTIMAVSSSCLSCSQGRYTRRADGVRAVPGGLGHSSGQQLQHHRHPLRWPRQRLPGHQLPAQSEEETGATGGEGPAGGAQVKTFCFRREGDSRSSPPPPKHKLKMFFFPFFFFYFRLISKEPYIDRTRMGVYGKVRRTYALTADVMIKSKS